MMVDYTVFIAQISGVVQCSFMLKENFGGSI